MPQSNSIPLYSVGYIIQKEFHYKKLKNVLESKEFIFRSIAYRSGIINYDDESLDVDSEKLAILAIHYWNNFKEIDIKKIDYDNIYVDTEYFYYAFNDGDNEYSYKFLDINDDDEIFKTVKEKLLDGEHIKNVNVEFMIDYMRPEFLEYEIDEDEIDQFDDHERKECPICLEEFENLPKGIDTITARCGHCLCDKCYEKIDRCPMCRNYFSETTIRYMEKEEVENYIDCSYAEDIWETIDDPEEFVNEMINKDGLAHTLGVDEIYQIDFDNIEFENLKKVMFDKITATEVSFYCIY